MKKKKLKKKISELENRISNLELIHRDEIIKQEIRRIRWG